MITPSQYSCEFNTLREVPVVKAKIEDGLFISDIKKNNHDAGIPQQNDNDETTFLV